MELKALVTDVISTHSYINSSSLQVFLYTQIDNLFKQIAASIQISCHVDQLFVVVANAEQKKSLLEVISKRQGFTTFSFIGTLREWLVKILNQKDPFQGFKIHDSQSLTFAIYELFLQQDPSLNFRGLKDSALQDLYQVYVLASQLSNEFNELQELKPDFEDVNFKKLKLAVKSKYPNMLFMDEAFALCEPYFNQLIFAGFSQLPLAYVDMLKKSSAQIHLLAPSFAFLGDVISPKQRLKYLRDGKHKLDESFKFDEHPLIDTLDQETKYFFHKIANLDVHTIDDGIAQDSLVALEQIKNSLYYGYIEQKINLDDSVCFLRSSSALDACLKLINQLQIIYAQDQNVSNQDICIIGNEKLYGPILNALSTNFERSSLFSSEIKTDLLWIILESHILAEEFKQDQNFFIKQLHLVYELDTSEVRKKLWLIIINLLKEAQFIVSQDDLKGIVFLKTLKRIWLSSLVFDYSEDEVPFDLNMIDSSSSELLQECMELFDGYIKFIENINGLKNKTGTCFELLNGVLDCLNHSSFKPLICMSFYQYFYKIQTLQSLEDTKINLKIFVEVAAQFFVSHKHDAIKNEFIKIQNISDVARSYKYCIHLGEIESQKSNLWNWKKSNFRHYLTNLQNTHKRLIFIKHEDSLSNKSDVSNFEDQIKKLLNSYEPARCALNTYEICKIDKKMITELANLDLSNLPSHKMFTLEAKTLKSYFTDLGSFIKKELLHVKQDYDIMDLDVKMRHLVIWKRSQYRPLGNNQPKQDWLYGFSHKKQEDKYLRSDFATEDEKLSYIVVKPALINENMIVNGLTSADLDQKFIKNPEEVKKLILMLQLVNGTCE